MVCADFVRCGETRSFRELLAGGGFFRKLRGGKCGTAGEGPICEEKFQPPAQDHAEGEQIKESAGLFEC